MISTKSTSGTSIQARIQLSVRTPAPSGGAVTRDEASLSAEASSRETIGIGPLGCSVVQVPVDRPGSTTVMARPPDRDLGTRHSRAPARRSPLASSTPRLSYVGTFAAESPETLHCLFVVFSPAATPRANQQRGLQTSQCER